MRQPLRRSSHVRISRPLREVPPLLDLPTRWTGAHVGLRLTDAMVTLRRLPMARGPAEIRSLWPRFRPEWQDLLAQAEGGEIERTMIEQNRVRLLPSRSEVSCMERAIAWPAEFLARKPEVAQATNMVALAHALDRDAEWVVRKLGGFADIWRDRHSAGCAAIASGLRAGRRAVW